MAIEVAPQQKSTGKLVNGCTDGGDVATSTRTISAPPWPEVSSTQKMAALAGSAAIATGGRATVTEDVTAPVATATTETSLGKWDPTDGSPTSASVAVALTATGPEAVPVIGVECVGEAFPACSAANENWSILCK